MKNAPKPSHSHFLALFFFLLASAFLRAQSPLPPELPPDGGGPWTPHPEAHGECVPAALREVIEAQLAFHMDSLQRVGLLPTADARQVMSLQWPVMAHPDLGWHGYSAISNFVDQQTTSAILDYNCGNRTYDGHRGLDIFSWPFAWWMMEQDLVEVIAAAPGTILSKFDGNSSYSCDWNGNQNWNAVYILHADGSVAWYGHLKENSLTKKPLGASVEAGEYLGIMASSGRSSGPHLHLEVYRQAPYTFSNLIDPYTGACNSLNINSWWADFQPYRVPTLNSILTHSQPMEFGCPTINEKPYFRKRFSPGATIYFGRYFRDQLEGHVSVHRIRRPNGTIYQEWSHTSPGTYNASWWWNSFTLGTNAPSGAWTYEAEYQGKTLVETFYYGVPYTCQSVLSASALEICDGESVTLSVTGTEGTSPYVYTWNMAELTGQGGTVSPPVTSTYTVTVSDHFGCSPGQASVTVQVKPLPDIGVSEVSGTLLSEQSDAAWQWLDCEEGWAALANETGAAFTPAVSGRYAVRVDLSGCVDTSDCVELLVTALDQTIGPDALKVFPNPSRDIIRVVAPGGQGLGFLILSDLLGRPVRTAWLSPTGETTISLEGLPSGIYLLTQRGESVGTRVLVRKE